MNEKDKWIRCSERLPASGQDIILMFRDTYHKHDSWPKISVKPAWRCNVGEESSPDGLWAIEGRLGMGMTLSLSDGICWMELPDIDKEEVEYYKEHGGYHDHKRSS